MFLLTVLLYFFLSSYKIQFYLFRLCFLINFPFLFRLLIIINFSLQTVTIHYFLPYIYIYIYIYIFIYPQDLDLHNITDRLNHVERSIKFRYELESNNTQPFLDILLVRNINKLEFKVYRKPTRKNDNIHFYLHHNNNTKRDIIIGFYLRALHIYSSKYLND